MFYLGAYLFAVSLLVTLALTPIAIRLGRRWGVLDLPDARKIHKEPTPLVGGWALFAAITIVVWGHLGAAWLLRGSASVPAWIPASRLSELDDHVLKALPVYGGAVAVFLLGLFDDLRGLKVRTRLGVQLGVGLAMAGVGMRPDLGFLPSWVGAGVGVLWIVGITNAFNFLDGLDGLSTGVSLVATSALLCVMAIGNQPNVASFLAMLAGTQLGFLRSNWHPARVFLGSSGSLLLGYLMGVSTLACTFMIGTGDNWLMPILIPVFILAVPLYDTTSVVLIRLLKRRSIAIGDQSHFHHRLMRLGFTQRQTVGFICLIALAVALSAIGLINSTLAQSLIVLGQIVAILSLVVLAERVAANLRAGRLDRENVRRDIDRRREELSKTESPN